jgi:hypothetical protein
LVRTQSGLLLIRDILAEFKGRVPVHLPDYTLPAARKTGKQNTLSLRVAGAIGSAKNGRN